MDSWETKRHNFAESKDDEALVREGVDFDSVEFELNNERPVEFDLVHISTMWHDPRMLTTDHRIHSSTRTLGR